jgi:putative transcriptional regulator
LYRAGSGSLVTPGARPNSPHRSGLGTLRRAGTVSDLLFLYECETRDVTNLRSIAERLGLTVQAASHTYRSLSKRGLVEQSGGRYRSTVQGVDWLHSALGSVRDDLAHRLDRLHIVRTTRAVATSPIEKGERVSLEIRAGTLTAHPGGGRGSRGRAHSRAAEGDLVEVGELEGIVPLPHGRLRVVTLPVDRLDDRSLTAQTRSTVRSAPGGLLLAYGLEARHVLGRPDPARPLIRYGVAAAIIEATRLGVDCTLVVVDRDLPRVFEQIDGPDVPSVEFLPLQRRPLTRLPSRSQARRQRRD